MYRAANFLSDSVYLRSMNRFLRLLVFVGTFLFMSACKRDSITYYTVGIRLINYDNAGAFIQEAGTTVKDSAYVIRINYTSDQTAYYTVNADYTYQPGNKPTSIAVTSLQNFDGLHPAGSLLNDYFINGPGMDSRTEDIVYDFPVTRDYYPTHDPDDLWLMAVPSAPGPYRFVVEMSFDNGITVLDTTAAITFVP